MYAKKSLGQNFLISDVPVKKMVEISKVSKEDTVLEIGPGRGILTNELLKTGAKIIAVEKDDNLTLLLKEKFSKEISSGQLTLINGDILDFDLSSHYQLSTINYKLISNIPYNITGEIMRKFLEATIKPSLICLLVQKEVAERIVSKDKKESLLSVSVKVFGTPHYAGTVKRTLFRPIPNVDSAILLIDNISNVFFDNCDENKFFEIVKAGFAHKRKQLQGNLSGFVSLEKLENKIGSGKRRAEELTIDEWKKLV